LQPVNKLLYTFALFIVFSTKSGFAQSSDQAVNRMNSDAANKKPLIAHVTVALADNKSQGIVPISSSLGNGDSPRTNLYWGALYGVKTYFNNHQEWTKLPIAKAKDKRVLERVVFKRTLVRDGKEVTAYVIADAWRGENIKDAIIEYMNISSGHNSESVIIQEENSLQEVLAGGAAHLTAYIGHNGLMEFDIPTQEASSPIEYAKSTIALACYSEQLFNKKIVNIGAHSLLTTNGLMAPEAYTLEAAISSWFSGSSSQMTHKAAASAYSKYQKAKLSWVNTLFSTSE